LFVCKVCMRNCAHIRGLVEPGNALSRVHGRLAPDRGWAPVQPLRGGRDEDPAPESHRRRRLRARSPRERAGLPHRVPLSRVAVARKSNCAFNTVRISSTGRPWIVDNDSRGGDDEHAQPNAELAIELTGQTRAERRTRLINLRAKTDIPLSALLCATFTTEEAAAAAEAAAAVKAAVEAGKKQRLEAATAAKLRGEPFAECSWREGGRQHEDARRARASLDAHRAAVAQMNETRQSSGSFEWRQPEKQQSRRGGSKLDCSTRAASSARRRPRPPPRPRSRRLPRPPPSWCCSHSGRGCTASSRAATPAAPSGQSRGSALRACCVKGSDEL